MLLSFTVSNWMSYRDEATLSAISSLERQHGETRASLPGFRSKKVLPAISIYGGNASGKTGILRALGALRSMVVHDVGVDGTLPLEPFMLDSRSDREPTRFDVTFLANEVVYRLVVEATYQGVCYESLEVIREDGPTDVYERSGPEGGSVEASADFFSDPSHVRYAAMSTRGNQLFLGSAVAQNVTELRGAYGWFANTLTLVGVGSHAGSFAVAAAKSDGFLAYAGDALSRLDTGICGLVGEEAGADALPRSASLRRRISELGDDELLTVITDESAGDYGFEMLTVKRGASGPEVQRLRTAHVGPDGERHAFSLAMESSGTQRLMGLLPMLYELTGARAASRVYVVDELDRCLHTMLTAELIGSFLGTCGPRTRKQLLFTTHDPLLMDQSLMRRDEMYIAQRGTDGRSELVGLTEFEGIRKDRDLIRSYLDGRFGGIPMLGTAGASR